MLRPKSSSSGRSFLDELLGNDGFGLSANSLSENSVRQRKSVRFFEKDESDLKSKSASSRPHSSTLNSLLNSSNLDSSLKNSENVEDNEIITIKQSSKNLSRASSADWLGLSTTMTTSESETDEKTQIYKNSNISSHSSKNQRLLSKAILPTSVTSISSSTNHQTSVSVALSTSTSSNSSVDWITSNALIDRNKNLTDTSVWQPKIFDSTTPRIAESITSTASENKNLSLTKVSDSHLTQILPTSSMKDDNSNIVTIHPSNHLNLSEQTATFSNRTVMSSQSNGDEHDLQQTKTRILNMEKEFLERTIEQMKINHASEIKSMIEIYEQQMRMTSEMYRRHEAIIQEERDKRIEEIKRHVQLSESNFDYQKQSTERKLGSLEEEWKKDIDNVREQNRLTIEKLKGEHKAELERLRNRFETQTDNSLNTSTEILKKQSENITQLLSKWEKSAFQIEQLQRSVLAHQETISRSEMLEPLTSKFTDIEIAWKKFFADYPNYVIKLDDKLKNEREILYQNAQKRTDSELKMLQNDRLDLENAKTLFAQEVKEWRQKETDSAAIYQVQRDKLKQDIILFEERRNALESLYAERKNHQDEEKKRIEIQFEQFQIDRKTLEDERIMLRYERNDIENQRIKLNEIRQEFDIEKEQLSKIAQTLSIKADELEKLSQVALKEKIENIRTIEDTEVSQKEIQLNLEEIQRSKIKIHNDERRLSIERAKLSQHWNMIKELGESAVCNLCGNSLNYVSNLVNFSIASITTNQIGQVNNNNNGEPVFSTLLTNRRRLGQSLMNIDEIEAFQQNFFEIDKTVMQLKMESQMDDVLLQEETNFVKTLKHPKTMEML